MPCKNSLDRFLVSKACTLCELAPPDFEDFGVAFPRREGAHGSVTGVQCVRKVRERRGCMVEVPRCNVPPGSGTWAAGKLCVIGLGRLAKQTDI
jgi:hypothetical protein